jgi:hypothetical protein
MIKNLLEFIIPYWFDRKLNFSVYFRYSDKRKQLRLTVWELHRLKINGEYYDDEWYSSRWKHFTLWNFKLK